MRSPGSIELIGAPFDLCGLRLGTRLGPAALRLAGLVEALAGMGLSVTDLGDACGGPGALPETTHPGRLRNLEPLVEAARGLRHAVDGSLKRGALPIVLGGDHALAVGAVAPALHAFDGDLALLWIDAHADVNTPGTSTTGNVHGMPLAALARLQSGTEGTLDSEWQSLLRSLGEGPALDLHRTAWYGLRDVDAPEADRLGGLALTMHDVDRFGVEATLQQFERWLRGTGCRHLWISFDVDVLDPILAPGTGTAVRGGLTYREAHLLAELLRENLDAPDCPYRLVGLDVVETNPLVDVGNQTAIVAVEWVASLFGKTILGRPSGGR
jgi:arginase